MAEPKKKTEQKKAEAPKPEIIRHEDGTVELTITVTPQVLATERKKIEDRLSEEVSVKGFRKGKAPKEIAKKRLSPETVSEELLKHVVTEEYRKALEKHKINPIITPQVHIEEYDGTGSLVFSAETAEQPQVKLGDYKKAVQDITAKSKITLPGKEPEKPSIDAIVTAGMSKATIQVPHVLVEKEVSRLLSQTLDELKSLGITLDQYLESKGATSEQLRDDYRKRAERDIQLEFFLRAVADDAKITVDEKDITEALGKIEDKAQQQEIMKNPYLVASIIRQQKTIDYLSQI